jgi:AGZA family xanthine/uracil permease-like MFS transporter
MHVEVRRDLVTATAALAGMATFMFGALTNLPVALAYEPPSSLEKCQLLIVNASPGMGLNAYFTFQVRPFYPIRIISR